MIRFLVQQIIKQRLKTMQGNKVSLYEYVFHVQTGMDVALHNCTGLLNNQENLVEIRGFRYDGIKAFIPEGL